MLDHANTMGVRAPHTIRPRTLPSRTESVSEVRSTISKRDAPASERRRHWRASPPSVLNGILALSVGLASTVVGGGLSTASSAAVSLFTVLAIGLVVGKAAVGLYPAIGVPAVTELRKSSGVTALVVGSIILGGSLYGATGGSQGLLLAIGLLAVVLTPVLRAVTRRFFARFSWWTQPLLIFDTGPAAHHLADHFSKNPGLGLRPILVDAEPHADAGPSSVALLASRHGALCAAFPLDGAPTALTDDLVRECVNTFPHLLIVPEMGGVIGRWQEAKNFDGMVGIRGGKNLLLPAPRVAKRVADWALALLIGIMVLPLAALIASAIRLTSPGPIFYGQKRIGRDRTPFLAWKFRTMHTNADEVLERHLASDPALRAEWEKDHKLKNDPRVTSVGRFLRKTSLDELPQLWNILVGEMSLVGPRPIVEAEAAKYGPQFERYLSVPPGLTGLWQVSGRNWTTYEERIRLDAHYVENWSLTFDAYILARTVKAVVTGHGAY